MRIVGDDPGELSSALADGLRGDLLVVSGGLGPTHDDRTVELLAGAAGLPLQLDSELEARIEAISRSFAARTRRPYADFAAGVSKQASLPEGAIVVGLAGTAPALLLESGDCLVLVLPGPPRELQALWPAALELEPFRRLLERAAPRTRRVLRFYGVGESAVAQALAAAGGEPDGVEVTICARDFEIHVDLLVVPAAEQAADELEAALSEPLAEHLFARSESSVEELVLAACARVDARDRGVLHRRARRLAAHRGPRREQRLPRRGRRLRERRQAERARRARRDARAPRRRLPRDRRARWPAGRASASAPTSRSR